MIIVSYSLTIGQLTFILRAIIQILSLLGPFLLGLIILSKAPRIAFFKTHDVINRIVGRLTATRASAQWIWHYSRRNTRDPIRFYGLPISISLVVLYRLSISISDIGFLGFYTCAGSGNSINKIYWDYPNSIKNEQLAYTTILNNFVNGTDPNSIKAQTCDSSEIFHVTSNLTLQACILWRNSTWTDRFFFSEINTTDSDMIMPRGLGVGTLTQAIDSTSYYASTGRTRIKAPTFKGGILVNPTSIGFQAIFGVPQIEPSTTFTLSKTMALEIEVGCMTLGMGSTRDADALAYGYDFFATEGDWRQYSGPEILRDILSNYTDLTRQSWLPYFNISSRDDNGILTANRTSVDFTNIPYVQDIYWLFPTDDSDDEGWNQQRQMLRNCTNSVIKKIEYPQSFVLTSATDDDENYMCAHLGLSGVIQAGGKLIQGQTNMLCSSTSQVNMVSASVRSSATGSIEVNVTRIPSDLNYIRADYWEELVEGNIRRYNLHDPLERYTLSDNPHGHTSHYIPQAAFRGSSDTRTDGVGNGGHSFSRVGAAVINAGHSYPRMLVLDDDESLFSPSTLTRWAGQVGAAYVLSSLQYNPWVALQSPPIFVTMFRDQLAICYHPVFVLAFIPLLIGAMTAVVWAIAIFWMGTRSTPLPTSDSSEEEEAGDEAERDGKYRSLKKITKLYVGLNSLYPHWISSLPAPPSSFTPKSIILIWQKDPEASGSTGNELASEHEDLAPNDNANPKAHLEVLQSERLTAEKDDTTVVRYIESPAADEAMIHVPSSSP